jgi:hypothetical protein
MPHNRRRRQRPNPPARAHIQPKKTILVVCEGKTEKQYVECLKQFIGNPGVNVNFSPKHGVPKTIVDTAKQEFQTLRTDYREEFDEVWCIFDRDLHPNFNASIQTARDRGYHLAVSNPCFELWLWLHHRPSPGPQTHTQMQAMLEQQVDTDFDKSIQYGFYFSSDKPVKLAVDSAFRLERQALEAGDPPFGNPSTTMYKLVVSMAKISKQGQQIEFFAGWEWLSRYT